MYDFGFCLSKQIAAATMSEISTIKNGLKSQSTLTCFVSWDIENSQDFTCLYWQIYAFLKVLKICFSSPQNDSPGKIIKILHFQYMNNS